MQRQLLRGGVSVLQVDEWSAEYDEQLASGRLPSGPERTRIRRELRAIMCGLGLPEEAAKLPVDLEEILGGLDLEQEEVEKDRQSTEV